MPESGPLIVAGVYGGAAPRELLRSPSIAQNPSLDVLVVCTGNICRSPMAEALLRGHLIERGVDARVHSAGTMAWGGGPTPNAIEAVRELGHDISGHISRQLTREHVERADLVLGMTRDHVRRVRRLAHDAFERAFLVGELLRLAAGARTDGEEVRVWAGHAAATRGNPAFFGRGADEVDDPIGEPLAVYQATASRLDRELDRLAALLTP